MSEKMKVVIAYDGSDCADAALDDLRRAGLPEIAQAVVISVADISLPRPSNGQTAQEISEEQASAGASLACSKTSSLLKEAEALALKATKRIQETFPLWEVRAETDFGSPASRILESAAILKADLIVVGSHGRSRLSKLILGSVSQRIVTEARCSVRVARDSFEESDIAPRIV